MNYTSCVEHTNVQTNTETPSLIYLISCFSYCYRILKQGYTPPRDLTLRLRKIIEDTTKPAQSSNWKEASLDDLDIKFQVCNNSI